MAKSKPKTVQFNNKQEFLQVILRSDIESAIDRVNSNKMKARFLFFVKLLLSASLTITLGITQFSFSKDLALTLGAFLTLITGIDSFFDFNKVKARDFQFFNDLVLLYTQLTYFLVGDHTREEVDTKLDEVFSKYEELTHALGEEIKKSNYQEQHQKSTNASL